MMTFAYTCIVNAYILDKVKLKKENEQLRLEITCRKCKGNRVQSLFLPCRHLVACEECAKDMDACI